MTTEHAPETMLQLDPDTILADDNSRFNLKKTRIDTLAESILAMGGVMQPVEVTELAEADKNGHTYRLTSGFYRLAAVLKLNSEQNAGLTVPAIVRNVDEAERLKHQLAENMERENQSPMDKAIAIKKLLDAGVPRPEVRRIFSSAGGRKGNTVQAMSNAMMNILLRFLELPKAVQEKIHDGRVGVEAAYELGKVAPDRRVAVLDRAEKDRLAFIDTEEKDEEKYLNAEAKLNEAQSNATEAEKAAEAVKEGIVETQKLVLDRNTALRQVQAMPYLELDAKGQKEMMEKVKAAEQDLKAAQKLAKDKKNELAKALEKKGKAQELAEKKAAELEAARKAIKPGQAAKGKAKPISKTAIAKAAKAEGAGGLVALNISEQRQTIKDVSNHKHAGVAAIGKAVLDCFNGKTTPKLLIGELEAILAAWVKRETGGTAAPPAPAAAGPAPAPATATPAPAASVGPTPATTKVKAANTAAKGGAVK